MRLARVFLFVATATCSLGLLTSTGLGQQIHPESSRLKLHIETLASPAFGGRSGAAAEKTRRYLSSEFERLGLSPLFDRSYLQVIPGREEGTILGKNVGARILGSDPKLREEWVVVAAHFDHLGVRNGILYPGADDNASGVAMMLEIGRCLTQTGEPPKRSVMLIAFDLEEVGLYGSRYFAEHSPVPIDRINLFITADMIGRSLGGVCGDRVFVMGTEHSPETRSWLEAAAKNRPITLGILGADLLLLDRSDYGPFRSRKVPFLFFSTGENPLYHSPDDVPETLDYRKVEATSQVIWESVRHAIGNGKRLAWRDSPDHGIDEAKTLREIYGILLEHQAQLHIGKTSRYLINVSIERLDSILVRGEVKPGERAGIVRMAQLIMASVF